MNRHHPYGGGFESSGPRRGFSGPGPDRSHRHQDRGGGPTRGRGFGRGRGNYSNYDGNLSHASYGQGPSQSNMGAYNEYNAQATPQEAYYANNYGAPAPIQFPQGPANGYSQGYAKFEGALEVETEPGYCKGFSFPKVI